MSARHRKRSEREQLELFRALPGDLAPRDAQDLMAYPFFSLAKTHRTTPIDYRTTSPSASKPCLSMAWRPYGMPTS
jgi:plasmid replication initiation protein